MAHILEQMFIHSFPDFTDVFRFFMLTENKSLEIQGNLGLTLDSERTVIY